MGSEMCIRDRISVIVEVDCRRGLLQEIRAFHFNLRIVVRYGLIFVLILSRISAFEPVDAVALLRLIDLCQDNLVKTHWLGLGLAEQGLEVVGDGRF